MVNTVHAHMRFKLILLPVLSALSLSPAIANDTAAQEFQSQAQSLGDSISSDNSGISDYCQRLAQDIADLKGKPQRRFTARQRYDQECRRSGSSTGLEFPGEEPEIGRASCRERV